MLTAWLLTGAVLLDQLLGEPRRAHPLVAFGRLAGWLEHCLNHDQSRMKGVFAWMLAVLPLTLLAWGLSALPGIGWLVSLLLLYLTIGLRSLAEHARPIAAALLAGDLTVARQQVGFIVSRQTDQLDETGVSKATIESVLENGSDAVFAALFWFVLLGAPGAVLYRLANTLDAMWGYRTDRFAQFGWAAARLDDVLNYVPARFVAITYALAGRTAQALKCWRAQAPHWDSPNAGPVMAAGAGALNVRLGGAAMYHGQSLERPSLGAGNEPVAKDIQRALRLVHIGVGLWLLLAMLIAGVVHA